MVVAIGVAADGRREALGFDVGDSENEVFWTEFLRSLKARGLDGVGLVISDAHTGLKKAISTVFQGAVWQRCRVHFMRNVLSIVPRASQDMVAAVIRTIFAQPDATHVQAQVDEVARMLERTHPKVAKMLHDARADILAFSGFPPKHWRQIWSTNPNASTKRSNTAPMSSACSPTPQPCSASQEPSSSSNTTSGKPAPAATSPRTPCANWTPSTPPSPPPTPAR